MKKNEVKCTDSDGGLNFNKKGFTVGFDLAGDNLLYEQDYCLGSGPNSELVEYYCNGTQVLSTYIFCLNGCQDAACVNNVSAKHVAGLDVCIDSDGGYNIYQKGIAKGINFEGIDSCSSDYQVIEYVCDGNLAKFKSINDDFCPDGYHCEQGACVEGCPTIPLPSSLKCKNK